MLRVLVLIFFIFLSSCKESNKTLTLGEYLSQRININKVTTRIPEHQKEEIVPVPGVQAIQVQIDFDQTLEKKHTFFATIYEKTKEGRQSFFHGKSFKISKFPFTFEIEYSERNLKKDSQYFLTIKEVPENPDSDFLLKTSPVEVINQGQGQKVSLNLKKEKKNNLE